MLHLVGLLGAVVPARCGAAGRLIPTPDGLPRASGGALADHQKGVIPARNQVPLISRFTPPDALCTPCGPARRVVGRGRWPSLSHHLWVNPLSRPPCGELSQRECFPGSLCTFSDLILAARRELPACAQRSRQDQDTCAVGLVRRSAAGERRRRGVGAPPVTNHDR